MVYFLYHRKFKFLHLVMKATFVSIHLGVHENCLFSLHEMGSKVNYSLAGDRLQFTSQTDFFTSQNFFYLLVIMNPISYIIIWQAPRAGKMNQILHCDWLPEQTRWSDTACLG